jgi:hypothetical protein
VKSGGKDRLIGAVSGTMEPVALRRSAQDGPGSSRWRCKHQGLFRRCSCGLPDDVLGSDRALLYVLLHGDDELGMGWTPAWIDHGQAEELLRSWAPSPRRTTGAPVPAHRDQERRPFVTERRGRHWYPSTR